MRTMARAAGALALLFPLTAGSLMLLFSAQKRAGANSAPAYWVGAQSSGALLSGDACPIEVEREVLTVNVPEFPSLSDEEGAFTEYEASVTAQYAFRNPTGEDYTATLLFPFGTVPEYAPCGYDLYGDTARYTVRENGSAVSVKSRYSYCGEKSGTAFDVDAGIGTISGTPAEHFFCEDTPVTTHTFRVTADAAEGDGRTYLTLLFYLKADPARTRIATSRPAGLYIDKGFAVVSYSFPRDGEPFDFSVYTFGEDATFKKQGIFFSRAEAGPVKDAAVEKISETSGAFGEFAGERYRRCGAVNVSEEDWLRGFSEALEGNVSDGLLCGRVPDEISAADFMRWYEYDLTFPAGEEVVNEVTAPIYPTVRGSGKGTLYDYTYLLSPARKWASFGSLRIELVTPYYLSWSSLDFEKTEEGYALDWEDGLPLGELMFTLSETESIPVDGFSPYRSGLSALQIAVVVLLGGVAVSTVVTVVLLVVLRKKPAPAQKNGEAREGKVDLPPEEKPRK